MITRPGCQDPCLACEADVEDIKATIREASAQMMVFGSTVVEVGHAFARVLPVEEHEDALRGGA